MGRAAEGIEIDVTSKVGERFGFGGSEQAGDQRNVDATAFVERDRQGILRRVDFMGHRRLDDAFGKDRARCAGVVDLIIILDRGDQPYVGVVEEGLQVGAALKFLLGAGFGIDADAGDGPIDRPMRLDELSVVGEQPFLAVGIGPIIELCAQDRADRIPDRDEAPDDVGVFRKHARPAASGFHADNRRHPVNDLVQDPVRNEVAAFLEVSFIGGGAHSHVDGDVELVAQRCCALGGAIGTFMSCCDGRQSGHECFAQVDTGVGRAGIFHAELPLSPFVRAQNMVRILKKIIVDLERAEAFVAVGNGAQFDPVVHGPSAIGSALLEKQDIDDDVGAGLVPHGFTGEANGTKEMGDTVDMAARFGIALVQGIS
ncbi:hypothetical protein D9M73_109680 [compost metagenome]